jgi:class 3 adenylate cyclase
MERAIGGPRIGELLQQAAFEQDVRQALPAITAPTLVLHVEGDPYIRVGHGRYLAKNIPGARYVEAAGSDHLFWSGPSVDRIGAEIREFLTGTPEPVEVDRVLATLLFTDVVDSTRHATELGDRRWGALLDALDGQVDSEVRRFQGRLIKSTGDGHLATFDGPGRAIRCALAVRDAAASLGVELRAGLHTGEIELRKDDIGGIAVHLAERVSAQAGPREVVVSRTVVDLVAGSGIGFTDRGLHELKGVAGDWQLFAVQP